MKSELHVIIIWQNARSQEKIIIEDIAKSFVIKSKYLITWSNKKAYENMSRFYAIKSRYAKQKLKHCGDGEFVLLVVEDQSPNYEIRTTSDGDVKVNINLFDKKALYRKWTGGGHKIHTTNTTIETSHNLAMIFGMTYTEYQTSLDNESKEYVLNQDLIGSDGWDSFEALFKVLNNTLEYVVLRNFEGFFDNIEFDEHLDIDLLVRNYKEAKLVLNSQLKYPYTERIVNQVLVAGKLVDFDLRSVSDGYMCSKWANDILKDRTLFNGYFRPNEFNYFYSLLYHAKVHKEKISNDYLLRFENLSLKIGLDLFDVKTAKSLLLNHMKEFDYDFSEPNDMSVYYNKKEFDLEISKKRKLILLNRKFRSLIKKLLLR